MKRTTWLLPIAMLCTATVPAYAGSIVSKVTSVDPGTSTHMYVGIDNPHFHDQRCERGMGAYPTPEAEGNGRGNRAYSTALSAMLMKMAIEIRYDDTSPCTITDILLKAE